MGTTQYTLITDYGSLISIATSTEFITNKLSPKTPGRSL